MRLVFAVILASGTMAMLPGRYCVPQVGAPSWDCDKSASPEP